MLGMLDFGIEEIKIILIIKYNVIIVLIGSVEEGMFKI